ncbi:hypothetical protein CRE_10970 [Caenorhabditis remanei]|uniref:Uncharacterized protein n=1 Tax=Caenorhabditis remanei TaxID=31234 RepID=E3M5S9_CAERE|nr:hypothetical protein CRE_10970 [Caenorhabditis remanei]
MIHPIPDSAPNPRPLRITKRQQLISKNATMIPVILDSLFIMPSVCFVVVYVWILSQDTFYVNILHITSLFLKLAIARKQFKVMNNIMERTVDAYIRAGSTNMDLVFMRFLVVVHDYLLILIKGGTTTEPCDTWCDVLCVSFLSYFVYSLVVATCIIEIFRVWDVQIENLEAAPEEDRHALQFI